MHQVTWAPSCLKDWNKKPKRVLWQAVKKVVSISWCKRVFMCQIKPSLYRKTSLLTRGSPFWNLGLNPRQLLLEKNNSVDFVFTSTILKSHHSIKYLWCSNSGDLTLPDSKLMKRQEQVSFNNNWICFHPYLLFNIEIDKSSYCTVKCGSSHVSILNTAIAFVCERSHHMTVKYV